MAKRGKGGPGPKHYGRTEYDSSMHLDTQRTRREEFAEQEKIITDLRGTRLTRGIFAPFLDASIRKGIDIKASGHSLDIKKYDK